MSDPFTSAAASSGVRLLAKAVGDWLKGSEFDRVLEIVADELGNDVGVSALAPLRMDTQVVELIAAFLHDPGSWEESALVKAIEPHVGQLTPEGSSRQSAQRIAKLIKEHAWRAFESDRDAIVHTVRAEVRGLSTQTPVPVVLTNEWIPRQAQAAVDRLRNHDVDEAIALEQALANESRRRQTISGLIRQPPREGSTWLWETLGSLALAQGLLADAETAFLQAAEQPGADRPRNLARATQSAAARGDRTRAGELLSRAKELDAEHPAVLLAEAGLVEDPQERLELLAQATSGEPALQASIDATRGLAYVQLGDFTQASEACDRAIAADSVSPFVRELNPVVTFFENRQKDLSEPIDYAGVVGAAAEFAALQQELEQLGRVEEAFLMASRTSEAYALAGDFARAAQALENLDRSQLATFQDGSRRQLAIAALGARLPDLALAILAGTAEPDDLDRLLLAQARLLTGADPSSVAAELDELLSSPIEPVAQDAARLRVVCALPADGVEWSVEAERILADADAALAAVLKATKLSQAGERDEAERLLLPHVEDVRAIELLVDLATDRGDFTTAVHLQRQLLERTRHPAQRVYLATLLHKAGDTSASLELLAELRADTNIPVLLRKAAFHNSLAALQAMNRFKEFTSVAAFWHQAMPEDTDAAWALVRGLAAAGRWREALDVLDRSLTEGDVGVQVENEEDAILAALVIAHALPPAESIPRIAALSDRFDNRVERLELLIINAGLAETDLPAEAAARQSDAFARFPERFPESQAIRAFQAPTTKEELDAFVQQHLAAGTQLGQEIHDKVLRGDAPVALLAAAAGKHVSETWAVSQRLFLGFGDEALNALELADARAGIMKPAVWDAASLYIVGGLGSEVMRVVTAALPGSVISQSTLEDVVAAADLPRQEGDQTLLGIDPMTKEAQITIITSDEVARQKASAAGVLALAQRLDAIGDTDPAKPTRFDEVVGLDTGRRSTTLDTWPATLAIAVRIGLPVFSDDRVIRVHARREGVGSFGTAALLEALVERELLSGTARDQGLLRLRISGAIGLTPSAETLIAEARDAKWDVSATVALALHDPTAWAEPVRGFQRATTFLEAVFQEAPNEFPFWTRRVIDAHHRAQSAGDPTAQAAGLLAFGWIVNNTEFAQALTREVRAAVRERHYLRDPLPFATGLLMSTVANKPEVIKSLVVGAIMRAVDPSEHLMLLRILAGG